jgi:SAM-dependent methyltransferase
MARRRAQLIPWRVAGGVADEHASADAVVRETGWVFNNETGEELTLAEFVMSGNKEVNAYLRVFGMNELDTNSLSLLEIGSGIGRMTARFTKRFASVIAADVDAAFLERCRETVARHGDIAKLRTSHVADGHSLAVPSQSVDAVFSYITLQHCEQSDALSLTSEAMRVARTGGTLLLNYRTWVRADAGLLPLGIAMRRLWRIPVVGKRLAVTRWSTRLGWQANRLSPDQVLAHLAANSPSGKRITNIVVHHSAKTTRTVKTPGVTVKPMKRVNKSHWWLTATVEGV